MLKSKKINIGSFYNGVFGLMLAGVVLYLLALPPAGIWWLGWLVSACWTPLLRRATLPSRAYRTIWLAGVIFWAVAVHWVCYAHWATCFGWVAMCCYLGIYFPLFVFFARILHHAPVGGIIRIPVWFAAPVAWLAVMYLQKTLMGGFGFALLEHTQVHQTALIQLADIGGESLVGAVMIFVGVVIGYCLPINASQNAGRINGDSEYEQQARKLSLRQVAISLIVVTLTFFGLMGYARLRESQLRPSAKVPLSVALLQGTFKASLSSPQEWYDEIFENYTRMALEASHNKEHKIDVIIWPESTCTLPWIDFDRDELTAETAKWLTEAKILQKLYENNSEILELTQHLAKPCIYGVASFVYSEKKDKNFLYNSALLIENDQETNYDVSSSGKKGSQKSFSRYDKMLLVMFGEYIPFADCLPEKFFLRTLCQKADFGKRPVNFLLRKQNGHNTYHLNHNNQNNPYYRVSANICFESSSSQLIRVQLLKLKDQGEEPDILVNLSNDGWFRHSLQIDLHLATHVFRAIENRKPYLAATNGGFSVGIDGSGKILAIGQRATNQVVYVEVTPDHRLSAYHFLGSFFHIASLGIVFAMFANKVLLRKT